MGRFLPTVTVVLVLVAVPACALRCYDCEGSESTCSKSTLEGDKDKHLKTCINITGQTLGEDRCFRKWIKTESETKVTNGCSNQFSCGHSKKACDMLNDYTDGVDCVFDCCDTDACNAGSPVSFSIFLLTACSALGLALM